MSHPDPFHGVLLSPLPEHLMFKQRTSFLVASVAIRVATAFLCDLKAGFKIQVFRKREK